MNKEKYIIDCDKWICGTPKVCESSQNCLGRGQTSLLNEEGYMCCLGQIMEQKGLNKDHLINMGEPYDIDTTHLEGFSCDLLIEFSECMLGTDKQNTIFAGKAMGINDNQKTTVKEKIASLTTLFKKQGIDLEFINIPAFT